VDKLFLTPEERSLGLSEGCELPVVRTPLGNIALAVCMDATYFETFRAAKRLGADYIILPVADMARYDEHLARRGAESRVTETGLPAVVPALVSDSGFPVLFTGKAGIYFPGGMNLASVRTDRCDGDGAAVSEIPLAEIRAFDPDPFCRENPAFGKRYIDGLIEFSENRKRGTL